MPPRPLTAAIACALACAAALAPACGDDEPTGPDTTTGATTTAAEPAEPTKQRREFERQIRAALLAQGQRRAVDIDCVIERLRVILSNATVDEAVEARRADEEIPQEAVDAAFEAGERCRRP